MQFCNSARQHGITAWAWEWWHSALLLGWNSCGKAGQRAAATNSWSKPSFRGKDGIWWMLWHFQWQKYWQWKFFRQKCLVTEGMLASDPTLHHTPPRSSVRTEFSERQIHQPRHPMPSTRWRCPVPKDEICETLKYGSIINQAINQSTSTRRVLNGTNSTGRIRLKWLKRGNSKFWKIWKWPTWITHQECDPSTKTSALLVWFMIFHGNFDGSIVCQVSSENSMDMLLAPQTAPTDSLPEAP